MYRKWISAFLLNWVILLEIRDIQCYLLILQTAVQNLNVRKFKPKVSLPTLISRVSYAVVLSVAPFEETEYDPFKENSLRLTFM